MNAKYSKVTLDTTTAELWTNWFYLPKKQCKQNCTDLNKLLKAVSHYICSAWLFGSRCSQSVFVSHLHCQCKIYSHKNTSPPNKKDFKHIRSQFLQLCPQAFLYYLEEKEQEPWEWATVPFPPTRSSSLRKRKLMVSNHTLDDLPVQLFGHEWATEWLVFYVHQCYTC